MAGPNLNKVPFDIAKMFDGVARRYDIVNDILSLGQTKAWRGAVSGSIEPKPGMLILDLAAGTGSSTAPLVAAGAVAIPVDFSLGMLKVGRKKCCGDSKNYNRATQWQKLVNLDWRSSETRSF